MASPQTKNGFTKIANELLDNLMKIRIPGECEQIMKAIIRKTYGFNKLEDRISISQFVKMTGLKDNQVVRARNKLLKMNLIYAIPVMSKDGKTIIGMIYSINKDYETWNHLPKRNTYKKVSTTTYQKVSKPLTERLGEPLTFLSDTKDKRHIKDIIKERDIPFEDIINHLSQITNRKYYFQENRGKRTRGNITARWNELLRDKDYCKNPIVGFYKVHLVKAEEWLGNPNMEQNLHPNCLYRPTNFWRYITQQFRFDSDHVTPKMRAIYDASVEFCNE